MKEVGNLKITREIKEIIKTRVLGGDF